MLSPGSEFRALSHLELILGNHEDWEIIKNQLENGITYPMSELPDEKTRRLDLKAMVERGNHKSAQTPEHIEALKKAYKKEVQHGWLIPLKLSTLFKLKGAGVIPLGVQDQFSVDETGKRITKNRVTHDC